MLGQILDQKFSDLLYEIAGYFRINEQKDFESFEVDNENLLDHNYLLYIDLAIALQDYVELDLEIAKRLFQNEKYKYYIKTNEGDDEVDLENPKNYKEVVMLENYLQTFPSLVDDWVFILSKY